MATATHNTQRLCEVVQFSEPVVDRAAGVIRGVKILGFESRNGRRYKREAVAEAIDKYEGRGVNLDHRSKGEPVGDRRVKDHFGELRNVQLREEGLYGDLHYLKSHPEAEPICERAERFPGQFGLSHDAEGMTNRVGDIAEVERIDDVISVDLVRYPATTEGLFESEDLRMEKDKVKEQGPPPAETVPVSELPPEVVPEETSGEDEKKAFVEQVSGILNDPEKTMEQCREEINALLNPDGVKEAEGEDSEEKKEEPVSESIQEARGQINALRHRLDLQEAMDETQVDRVNLSPEHFAMLGRQTTKEDMVKLIESWPPYLRSRTVPSGTARAVSKNSSYDELRTRLVK